MQALGAEIVVTFEGCSEGGDQFMARQSYLPDEIHWGFTFASIISRAPGSSTRHTVDISKCVLKSNPHKTLEKAMLSPNQSHFYQSMHLLPAKHNLDIDADGQTPCIA